MAGAFAREGRLKSDEHVMFLPGLAVERADGSFGVDVDAWVFEKESKRLAVSALTSWLGVDLNKLPPEQKALFFERTRYFRTDSERGKRLRVRLADQLFTLPRTKGAGRTHARLRVEREWVKWENGSSGFGSVRWTLEAPRHPAHGQEGYAKIIPAEGVSIVSDIDDTIKISNVLNRKTLVRNTFLEPFRAVPGMAEWYSEMARNEQHAFFHYLSASPIQLHPALSEFLKDGRFPPGVLHLREATSKRTLYAGRKTTIAHKKNVIARLLMTYPRRKFILIGDSGENDPEIYADIFRAHPERILAIHIRNVTNEDRAAPRYQQTFAGIDPQIWHIRD
ncbi:MAG: App1 family protein [Betaproteobacteria bacterium]|nr:App1 family protein [Betaproteobacteria bacterium]MCL2162282.1 App1 family protein [Betaproteobacteria bacterium]